MHRPVFAFAVVLTALGLLTKATAPLAGVDRTAHLVGSYSYVERITTSSPYVLRATLVIDSYDPYTRTITGHGIDGQLNLTSMSGRVARSSIAMRIANEPGVSSDQGTIHPNGTISGKVTSSYGGRIQGRGTWVMTPTVVAVGQVGFTVRHIGLRETDVSVGLEIRNTSRTHDAFGVTVDEEPLPGLGMATKQGPFLLPPVRVIPAGHTLYFGVVDALEGWVSVAGFRVTAQVDSQHAKREVTPAVTDIRIDREHRAVTASYTNPYRTTMTRHNLAAFAALYDQGGRIVGGMYMVASGEALPGGHGTVKAPLPSGVSPQVVAFVKISVSLQ